MIAEHCAQLEEAAAELPDPVARLRFYVTEAVQLGRRRRARAASGRDSSLPSTGGSTSSFPTRCRRPPSPSPISSLANSSSARGRGLLPETIRRRDAWFVTKLVMAVYHHYAFADSDRGTATTAEDLWQFCRRALGARPGA